MIAEAVESVVALVPDAGLSPSEKLVAAPVVAAAVEAGTEVEIVVAAPRGLSIKDRPLAAVLVAAAGVAVEVGATPNVNPVADAGAAAIGAAAAAAGAVETGAEKSEGPEGGAAWVDAGGAGVDEGLIPKVNPPPCPVVAAAVEAGWGWGWAWA